MHQILSEAHEINTHFLFYYVAGPYVFNENTYSYVSFLISQTFVDIHLGKRKINKFNKMFVFMSTSLFLNENFVKMLCHMIYVCKQCVFPNAFSVEILLKSEYIFGKNMVSLQCITGFTRMFYIKNGM